MVARDPRSDAGDEPQAARADYRLKPILLDAATAHREGWVRYDERGVVTLSGPALPPAEIPTERQFPAVRATFDDLNKALSRLANSPLMEGGATLRDLYEKELEHYEALALRAYEGGGFEPDYGTYVYDHHGAALYLVAPEPWHRLALVTSNSRLVADPEGALSWREIRARLEGAVVGFAGMSVGGNLLEGWLREARPRQVKIADPDWVEATNLNRGERMSLRHVVGSRAQRFEARNPYDVQRVSKADYIAYEQNLVDPYLRFHVYGEGLTRGNIETFLRGDGAGEPPIDILVEEMDHLELKIEVRQAARRHGIDVLMLSDFGHRAAVQWNYFRDDPASPLGCGTSDQVLLAALEEAKTGGRDKVFEFIGHLCGADYADDAFGAFAAGRGEQPTSSIPQSGATAMASGAIGGKELALRVLGHRHGEARRVVYDLRHRKVL